MPTLQLGSDILKKALIMRWSWQVAVKWWLEYGERQKGGTNRDFYVHFAAPFCCLTCDAFASIIAMARIMWMHMPCPSPWPWLHVVLPKIVYASDLLWTTHPTADECGQASMYWGYPINYFIVWLFRIWGGSGYWVTCYAVSLVY